MNPDKYTDNRNRLPVAGLKMRFAKTAAISNPIRAARQKIAPAR
jgi:hypothetical protein